MHQRPQPASPVTMKVMLVVLVVALAAALFAMPRRVPPPAVATAQTGAAPTTAVPPAAVVPGRGAPSDTVVVVGDSITDQGSVTLLRRLGAEHTVVVSAAGGARADEREGAVPGLAASRPDQVIINLGTNDVIQGTPTDASIASLTRIAEGFPSARCIDLVTVSENLLSFDDPGLDQRAAALNVRIDSLARQRGWGVIRWNDIVRDYEAGSHPFGPLTGDSVHPTATGQWILADAYARSLETCSAGVGARDTGSGVPSPQP